MRIITVFIVLIFIVSSCKERNNIKYRVYEFVDFDLLGNEISSGLDSIPIINSMDGDLLHFRFYLKENEMLSLYYSGNEYPHYGFNFIEEIYKRIEIHEDLSGVSKKSMVEIQMIERIDSNQAKFRVSSQNRDNSQLMSREVFYHTSKGVLSERHFVGEKIMRLSELIK